MCVSSCDALEAIVTSYERLIWTLYPQGNFNCNFYKMFVLDMNGLHEKDTQSWYATKS